MQTIKTYESEAKMICESVFEKHINIFMKQLKEKNYSVSKTLMQLGVAWDKIDASRVKVYNHVDSDVIRDVKKAFENRDAVIFGLCDDEIGIVYSPTQNKLYYIGKDGSNNGLSWVSWEDKQHNPFYQWEQGREKLSWKQFNAADEIWIVNIKGKLNVLNKRDSRKESQIGVWDNSPEFYIKWLKRNLERYRTMAIQIRAQKGDEFNNIMDCIDERVEKIMSLIRKYNKIIEKRPDYNLGYSVRNLNDDARWMLGELNSIIDYRRRMEERKHDGGDIKYLADSYNSEIKNIKTNLDKIDERIEDVKKQIDEFEK